MKQGLTALAFLMSFAGVVSHAQSTAVVSGTVFAATGSTLQGASIIACLLENDTCSDARSSVQAISGGSSAPYRLANLEAGGSYLMLAWKDVNANGEVDAGDELGVYAPGGKPVLVVPPAEGVNLRMAKFNGDLDALLAQAEANTAPVPAPSPSSSPPPSNQPSSNPASALTYTIPKDWRSTGGGNYVAVFGKEDSTYRQGRLDMQIFPPRAKTGALTAQTRAIWQAETKGTLDYQNQKGAVFVRRTASGLNVGVTFGTAGSFDNSGNDRDFPKLSNYSVLFVVETGAVVTPIFFKLSRAESGLGYITYEKEGRPLMLQFMRGVKSAKPVTVPPLYVEKDFLGKWKETSGTYNATNWYTPSGSYATSTYVSTGFTLQLTFRSGGLGQYFAQLTTVNTGAFSTQKEDEAMRWRINGDQIILERPKSGRRSVYQLFGRGADARGDPVFLTDLMIGGKTVADLDASPEDTWVVDR